MTPTPTARPILFVSSAGSGVLNPMLVLAGEFARRGIENLWFAADEDCRDRVEALADRGKVAFASLGEAVPELVPTGWDDETYRAITQPSTWKALRATALHTFEPSLRTDKYERLEEIVRQVEPGLVVADKVSPFAARLAIAHGIRYVVAGPFLPSNVLFPKVPKGFPVPNTGFGRHMTRSQRLANRFFGLRQLSLLRHPRIVRALARFVRARRRLGIPASTGRPAAAARHAELILCHTVPGVDYAMPLPGKLHMFGAMIPPLPEAPGADAELDAWLDAHDSIVYIGLGTITRLTREQVDTLVGVARALGDHHVLWKLPREQHALLPADLPPNLRIESWLPSQLDVLAKPNVRVFVNHAGGGGFHEGLYFGKPMVLCPLWVDCHDQAVRGEDAGVSLTLARGRIDLDEAVHKIRRVLTEPSFRERAAHFRRLQLEAGGRVAAAEKILALPALR
ncbi:MAG TPA: glycosyltransferase [Actinophytocola sp.]|jgi:polyene glycosyltransferase|nr:glycosyltransferase [Actinophytocola sp.]